MRQECVVHKGFSDAQIGGKRSPRLEIALDGRFEETLRCYEHLAEHLNFPGLSTPRWGREG
jgi:hypothetical protein